MYHSNSQSADFSTHTQNSDEQKSSEREKVLFISERESRIFMLFECRFRHLPKTAVQYVHDM